MRNPCEFRPYLMAGKIKAENRPNNHDSFCRLVSDPAFHHGLSATNTGRSTNIRPCFRSPLRKNNRIVQPYYYIQSSNPATGYQGLRTATHTFTIHATDGKVDKIILFDRRSDPYQMNNIAIQHPKLVNRLKSQLKNMAAKKQKIHF